jgi:hypothetical protein
MSLKVKTIFSIIVVLHLSCKSDYRSKPDVSAQKVDLQILRFENDYYGSEIADLNLLKAKYPLFYDIYFGTIMAEFELDVALSDEDIEDLRQNPFLLELLDSCKIKFPSLEPVEKELIQALALYQHYTGDTMPKTLVTFISEYGLGAATFGDDTLGVGLDMYLGEGFSGYDPTVFPTFIRSQMKPDFIVPHVIKALCQNLIAYSPGIRMLDVMIYNGKVLYLMDLLMPDLQENMKMEYSDEQMSWVRDNEVQIWSHFINRDLLYSTRRQDYQKLVGPSPNAPNMPPEAPGQTANYIGWKIVNAYMKKNQEVSLREMLNDEDAQKILELSKYRPR